MIFFFFPCKANLTEESLADEWDRIKVVCSQPYKKDSQFGLAFIRLRSLEDKKDQDQTVSPGPTMTKVISNPILSKYCL